MMVCRILMLMWSPGALSKALSNSTRQYKALCDQILGDLEACLL